MRRIGVDHAVAAAHGYGVAVDANGVEYPVPASDVSPNTVVTPDISVTGECGTSWVYFDSINTTTHHAVIETGFSLANGYPGAVMVQWDMTVADNYGVSYWNWTDPTASVHYWKKTHSFTSSGPGKVYANLVSGLATLWDGTLCYSYEPFAIATL